MTLIVACRDQSKTIYCSDFRVTKSDMQSDALVKWLSFGNRIGLLVAGDVNLWKHVKDKVDAVVDSIDIDNIVDQGGPFLDALIDSALYYSGPRKTSGAIGFILDIGRGSNRQFEVEVATGKGARIRDLSQDDVIIRGTGACVPDIEKNVRHAFYRCRDLFGEDLFQIGHCIRNEIYASFGRSGPTSFEKYHVSPIMGLALLEGATFRIVGEIGSGFAVNDHQYVETGYSFASNKQGGMTITDDIDGSSIELPFVHESPSEYSNPTIDPEHRTDV